MPKNLPGMYYDEGKRKYFKILPNHLAPKGSRYSEESVKMEENEIKKRMRDAVRVQRQLQSQIQHSRLLQDPLGGMIGLRRELGDTGAGSASAMHSVWARGLEKRSLFTIPDGSHYTGAFAQIPRFVSDEATGAIIYGRTTNREHENSIHAWYPYEDGPGHSTALPWSLPMTFVLTTKMSSLTLSTSRVLLATTLGGDGGACLWIGKLPPESLDDIAQLPPSGPPISSIIGDYPESVLIERDPMTTYWSSAAKPDLTVAEFVVGTSSGMFRMYISEGGWESSSTGCFRAQAHDDTLAVEWLNHNLIMGGQRDGLVRLWDTRSDGFNVRLRHPTMVNHVRKLDEYRVVVAGLKNQLLVYDLRFSDSASSGRETNPFSTFPTYKNWDHPSLSLGFDVHHNLIACGTTDGMVQIFDSTTGDELQVGHNIRNAPSCKENVGGESPEASKEGERRSSEPEGGPTAQLEALANCVKFVDDEEDLRLLVATGGSIRELSW